MSHKYPDAGTEEAYYPGSTRRIPQELTPPKVAKVAKSWDANPLIKTIRGQEVELFSIGDLAKALNRKPVTIRAWETKKWLPRAGYMLKGKEVQGNRRLYTRPQIEGLIQIAREEQLLEDPQSLRTPIQSTRLTERAFQLWKELALAGNP